MRTCKSPAIHMNRGLWDFSCNRKLLCFVILFCYCCHKSREFDERIFFTKQSRAVYNKFTRNLLVFTPSVQTDNPFLSSFFIQLHTERSVVGVIVSRILVLMITGVAVLMDLYQMKIKNSWILFSLAAGFAYDLWRGGWNGTAFFISGTGIPLVILGWLFYFRMLGSGDIKLFCVLGGIMGPVHILWCIWYAFLTGGILSLTVLIFCGGFSQRLHYLMNYINDYIRTGKRKAYCRNGNRWENIHFTVPIFMSVMLYMGGMY